MRFMHSAAVLRVTAVVSELQNTAASATAMRMSIRIEGIEESDAHAFMSSTTSLDTSTHEFACIAVCFEGYVTQFLRSIHWANTRLLVLWLLCGFDESEENAHEHVEYPNVPSVALLHLHWSVNAVEDGVHSSADGSYRAAT